LVVKLRTWGALGALTLVVPFGLTAPAHAAAPPTTSLAKPFDLNGDGYPELVVGAPDLRVGSTFAGGVFVLPGSRSGLSLKEKVITQSSAGVPGASESYDSFGRAVASADFDRDGFADLAIGQPGENLTDQSDESGAVTVVYGSKTGLDTNRSAQLTLPGSRALGTALVAADLTGDGYPDLAVGSPYEDPQDNGDQDYSLTGMVHVLRGGAGGLTTTGAITLRGKGGTGPTGYDVFFGSLLAAGDLDGDGRADLVVGSQGARYVDEGYPGSVSVCLGKGNGPTGCTQVLQDSDIANMSALAVGNVVGSRTSAPEIVVGAYLNSEDAPGLVSILRLSAGATTLAGRTTLDEDSPGVPGSAEYDAFGTSVAVGDIDRDGHDDLVIGSPREDERGRVTVVRGGTDGYAKSGNYVYDQNTKGVPGTSEHGDRFGAAVTLIDHDADGHLDLSVGAPGENTGDGAVTFLRGSGTRFTTKGSKAFSARSLGYEHPSDGSFGYALGVTR
jgi:FG-GAP repeat